MMRIKNVESGIYSGLFQKKSPPPPKDGYFKICKFVAVKIILVEVCYFCLISLLLIQTSIFSITSI